MLLSPTLFHTPISSLPFLPTLFPSDRMQSLEHKNRGCKWEKCKQSLGSNKHVAWLSHSSRKGRKGSPPKSLEACVCPFAGWFMISRLFQVIVNWPFSLQSTFTYLIASDLHNNCRAPIIFLILQMSQLKLTMIKKWAHKLRVERQSLNLNPEELAPPLEQFHSSHAVSWK